MGIAVSGQALDSGWRMLDLTGPPLVTGGAFGLEGGLIATMATTVGIVVLWASRRWLGRNRLGLGIDAHLKQRDDEH